ncbi:carboxylesterase/lipase family protein [Silvibacterium dinghuense]|nr:carboxylesterase family protein [Silvibacterium dinghuense]GGH11941.1 carboxylic ester hydrolase [Silvibacterium dinghuense]
MTRALKVAAPLVFAFSLTALAANSLVVKTNKGKVQGAPTSDGQVIAFKGIPYAAPPVGDLRWKPPIPAEKWNGIRQATEYGSHCVQTNPFPDMVFHDPSESEDCLTLNVWVPKGAKPGSLPVMVWIYGGGYYAGGTSEARQDGQFLAHRNVVVVTLNYRLGIFGFFAHPGLSAESPHHASGNYGLMDQTAAIEWVVRNIKAFGGDPKNLTLFGESAGSFSVSAQLASPLAKDHIQKAIGESGAAFFSSGLSFPAREAAEKIDADFAEAAFHTTNIADLRKVSAADLVKASTAKTTPPPPRFGPDVDGYFLPDSVPNIYAAGKQAHIPLLAGWNADEVRGAVLLAPQKMTAERFRTQAQAEFTTNADRFLELYPANTDEEAVQSAGDYVSDRFIAFSTWRWLEAQVKTGSAPVYRYRFDLPAPTDKFHPVATGAFHSDDIEYVFGTLDSRPDAKWRPEDRALSDQIQQYWTNFARTGDPNGPGLPKWPTYNADDDWQIMHLNATSEAKPEVQRDRYLFLDSVWSAPKKP